MGISFNLPLTITIARLVHQLEDCLLLPLVAIKNNSKNGDYTSFKDGFH